jgi:putative transposase
MRKPYPTDLSDAEWNYIEPHLPAPAGRGRTRIHSPREILDAIFYLHEVGEEGLIVAERPYWGMLELLAQLGLLTTVPES